MSTYIVNLVASINFSAEVPVKYTYKNNYWTEDDSEALYDSAVSTLRKYVDNIKIADYFNLQDGITVVAETPFDDSYSEENYEEEIDQIDQVYKIGHPVEKKTKEVLYVALMGRATFEFEIYAMGIGDGDAEHAAEIAVKNIFDDLVLPEPKFPLEFYLPSELQITETNLAYFQ